MPASIDVDNTTVTINGKLYIQESEDSKIDILKTIKIQAIQIECLMKDIKELQKIKGKYE